MADLDLESFEAAKTTSEIMTRPNPRYAITSQAEFLGLALLLRIPIIAAKRNIDTMSLPALSGHGASFAVFRYDSVFEAVVERDFVNTPGNNWFATQTTGNTSKTKLQYVTKRIAPNLDEKFSDAQRLACIGNEIRILSNMTLRKSCNIVTLLGISWFEQPIKERYWPQLLIERAEHGTLKDYLDFKTLALEEKCCLSLDILSGLNFLHIHGITHCDLKPANILIFENDTSPPNKIDRCDKIAKICDFGHAVIHSDYPAETPFQARIGSFPWAAPELEHIPNGLPVPLTVLHNADVYSFGLVYASILMNGVVPFQGLCAEQVTSLKLEQTAYEHVESELKAEIHMHRVLELLTSKILILTLQPNPEHRLPLENLMHHIKLQLVISETYGLSEESSVIVEGSVPQSPHVFHYNNKQWQSSLKIVIMYCLRIVSRGATNVWSAISTTLTVILGSLSRTYERQDHTDPLHKAIFARGFLETDLIAAIDSAEVSENSIGRSSPVTDENTVDRHEESSTHLSSCYKRKLKPLPDLCFEDGYVGCTLPRVTAQEVIKDLELQAANKDCTGDILYELADAYFNGSVAQRNPIQGLELFRRAVKALYPSAIMLLYNVYESCQQTPPDASQKIFASYMRNNMLSAFMLANADILSLSIPQRVNHNHLFLETCARIAPLEYAAGVASFNPEIRIILLRVMHTIKSHQQLSSGRSLLFDFDTIPSFHGKTMGQSSQIDHTEFVQDVKRLKCLECPGQCGFTLLQKAVSSADITMVNLLIGELGANVDNHGNTPGWTPLWLACFTGQIELAIHLIQLGASKKCRDQRTGYGILHLMNCFSDQNDIDRMMEKLSADKDNFDVNEVCEKGLTPLHTSLLGCDLSHGYAARCLLNYGADPMKDAIYGADVVTPIDLCMLRLDYVLLGAMISCTFLSSSLPNREIDKEVAQAKARAFLFLLTSTEFQFRSSVGQDWKDALKCVLRQLVDNNMQRILADHKLTEKGFTLWEGAIGKARSHIAQGLLDLDLVDFNLSNNTYPTLHGAIEQRMDDVTFALIARGADLSTKDKMGRHALHIAAHYHPAIVEPLIGILEGLPEDGRHNRGAKQILELRTDNGYDMVGLLLAEGSQAELLLVERLRNRFDLDLDAMLIGTLGNKITLAGALILIGNLGGLIPLTQINYLFDLDSPPRFVCHKSGKTLLHFAVRGQMNYQTSMDYTGHRICKLVLQKYGTLENILQSDVNGVYATHDAAYYANRVALDTIQTHLASYVRRNSSRQQVSFGEIVNLKDSQGATALDYVTNNFMDPPYSQETDLFSNARLLADRRPAAKDCYRLLRESGAMHSEELSGLRLMSRVMYTKFVEDDKKWAHFLAYTGQKIGVSNFLVEEEPLIMRHHDDDPIVITRLQNEPHLAGAVCNFRVVELIWRLDNFVLRIFKFRCSPFVLAKHFQDLDNIHNKDAARLCERFSNLDPSSGIHPWSVNIYEQKIPGEHGSVLTWTRRGEIWTDEEVIHIRETFAEVWTDVFGDIEERITSGHPSGMTPILVSRP